VDGYAALRVAAGIEASDELIRAIAAELQAQVADQAMLARFGDFGFAVLQLGRDEGSALGLAERLRAALEHHLLEVRGRSIAATCSVGVVPVTETAATAQQVLALADQALRAAVKAGGNRVHLHNPVRERRRVPEVSRALAEELRDRLEQGSLPLLFQPIIGLHGDTRDMYEVLVGLLDAQGAPVPRHTLFSVAEPAGLTTHLDRWLLDAAIDALAGCSRQGRPYRFFVKPSDQVIRDETTLLHLQKRLKGSGVRPECLVIELSEIAASTQVKLARAFLQGLKQVRCGSALVYFGMGLNSFRLLNHLDVDFLKIDGSFIRGLAGHPEHRADVQVIQEVANRMGKKTIAPAVADANTLAILWQCGVNYAQGAYIQAPSRELSYDYGETG
jgi:diguanylate cyclase (GGDEF)-like protein